jgi:hypothetical protein
VRFIFAGVETMTVIEVNLDEQTMAQMQREASRQQAKLETLVQELIKRLVMAKVGESTLVERFFT